VLKSDLVATKYFFQSAKFSFDTNKLWTICKTIDDASITKLSKKINGGTNGFGIE
jgi:predicted chitinase